MGSISRDQENIVYDSQSDYYSQGDSRVDEGAAEPERAGAQLRIDLWARRGVVSLCPPLSCPILRSLREGAD